MGKVHKHLAGGLQGNKPLHYGKRVKQDEEASGINGPRQKLYPLVDTEFIHSLERQKLSTPPGP